jgi:hypothetical protein
MHFSTLERGGGLANVEYPSLQVLIVGLPLFDF